MRKGARRNDQRELTGRPVGGRWLEALEPRQLLSSAFTAEEVYLAELINRARSDPAAEGVRLGIDLTDGLTSDEASLIGPVEPLALDLPLTEAARAHSLDMATRGFFDHLNPDGLNPTQRARAAGYSGVAGETIAAGQPGVEQAYESWMDTAPNRLNLLSLFLSFDGSFHYDQIGPGFAIDVPPAEDHYTALFGDPGAGSTAWLLGVIYDDLDADSFYTVGEGFGGVQIDVAASASPETIVATFTTDDAGNYQLELGDGSWVVTFTDLATGDLVQKDVVTSGQNVKLDAIASEFAPPGDGGGGEDDHADDGDYPNASLISLDQAGAGGASGIIGLGSDTDLFTLTSSIAGSMTIVVDASSGELVGSLTLESDAGVPLAAESAAFGETSVSIVWDVPVSVQYFLVVGSGDQASTGAYTVTITLDDGSGGGGGGGADDDHADDGDYANATPITLAVDQTGSGAGAVEVATDTDLFYFTTGDAGVLSVTLDTATGSLLGELTLKSDAGLALAIESATSGETSVVLAWNVPAGAQYFLVIGSVGRASAGSYSIALAITEASGGGDGGSDGGTDGGNDGGNAASDDSPPVAATSDASGALTVVRTDDLGRPIVFLQQPDGSWSSVDLVAEAGGPTPEGRFSTFVDPVSGQTVIVSASSGGLAMYSRDDSGAWRVRNLSAEIGAAAIASKPVTFTTGSGLVYTAGLDDGGNLVAYHHTGVLDGQGDREWTFEDITTDHLQAQGLIMPDLAGRTLIAYVTAWNGLTIAGLDADGNVQAAWWAPGMEKWRLANLSAITGAPSYEGTISAYLTPWQGINIAGTDANGDLAVVWWVPSFGGEWRLSKLNQILDGPALLDGTIASWVTPWGGLNISGLTGEGKVIVYWWTPTSDGWKITPLSDYISSVDPPATGVIGHTTSTGVISIMGLSEAGDLVRYWWSPGERWAGESLSLIE